jgi:hypothetical protein
MWDYHKRKTRFPNIYVAVCELHDTNNMYDILLTLIPK